MSAPYHDVWFRVAGDPIPQGSARAFVVKGRAVVTTDNPRLKAWRREVAEAARAVLRADHVAWDFPVAVWIDARMPRPKTVSREFPTGAREGDADKIARAVLDAMTEAGVYVDDSRVVSLTIDQRYAEPPEDSPGVTVWAYRRSFSADGPLREREEGAK
jgi:Holliday junction resolvase RusA-like endonuclease